MTRTALTKICLFIGLFAICIGLCIAIDASLGANPDDANARETPRETPDSNAPSILEMLEGDDLEMSRFAAACFGLTLDAGIPSDFQAETLDPSDFAAAYASGKTMSFTYDGSLEDARDACERSLKQKGWMSLQENDQFITSFVKSSGTYRSLIVQYLSMDGKTIILIDSPAQ